MKRLSITIFIALLMCDLILFGFSASSAEPTATTPVAAYQYNGFWSVSPTAGIYTNLKGVSADITYNSKPTVTNGSMSSIWTMLTQTTSQSLAQVGYALDLGVSTNIYYFMGIINSAGKYREYVIPGAPALNSSHNYKVTTSTASTGGLNANGALDGTTYFTTYIDFVPDEIQCEEEILNGDAHFMGKSSLHERISNAQALDGTTWVTPSPVWQFSSYGGMTNSTWANSHYIEVWDNRY